MPLVLLAFTVLVAAPTKPNDPVTLARALELYDALEWKRVIAVTDALLGRDDLPLADRIEALRLNGSAKAVVQDPVDAQKPFRLLVRLKPDYELAPNTAPKIRMVFTQVQKEEADAAEQAATIERQALAQSVELLDEGPASIAGGRPLPFAFRVRDPRSAVEAVTVPYRRAGEPAYSALALKRNVTGTWSGELPAEFTAGQGFMVEYRVEATDRRGLLAARGSAIEPLRVEVTPGEVPPPPKPLSRKWFWTGLGVSLVSAAATSAMALLTLSLQAQHDAQRGLVDAAENTRLERQGASFAMGTNIGLAVTAAFAIATAVIGIFLTDWVTPQQ